MNGKTMSIDTDALNLLLRGWSQHSRFLWMHTTFGADSLIAESLRGWEAVGSGGFRFELTALSENARLAIGKLIGSPILIEWQAAEGSDTRRPIHGHVIAAELIGSNGGLARFRFTIEPWFALLRQRVDSYNYQHASVIDISEQIFGYYARGSIAPSWRWALIDQSKYRKRSLTAQAGESDFDFLQRLWAEEGIFYWFEHEGEANSSTFGQHTLVLADSNQQFKPDDPVVIGFHQKSDGEPTGNIQEFMAARRWRIGQVARASWDYRTLSTRPSEATVKGAVMPGVDRDVAGPYAYQTAAIGDYRAQQQLDAQRVAAARSQGRGTRRDMRPGTRFAMRDHPAVKVSQAFVCLGVEHEVRANVDADVHGAIERRLGKIPPADEVDAFAVVEGLSQDSLPATGAYPGDALLRDDAGRVYGNAFVALPVEQSYRPQSDGLHGVRSHPEAVVQGAQTAIVVGSDAPIHTDRDHRVRIQHHAQRGGNAASREEHPRESNAPGDHGAGTWTRMMTPIGGDNWGGVAVPRVGQEVWVDWLEGQPDRPVAVASLYNGIGNDNAQHNARAGGPSGSTGNAAAWFAGNGHAATLTGFKTQDLGLSQQGTGGYRHFMMDDTAGQPSVHLYTTDSCSGLMLGHLKSMKDNVRQADRGYGVDLNTEASGAVRGGSGVLLSAAAGVTQMDASGAAQVLGDSHDLLDRLAQTASAQGAEPGTSQSSAVQPNASLPERADPGTSSSTLAAVAGLRDCKQAISATKAGSTSNQATGGGGSATAWSRPHLVAYGQDGVVAASAKSHVWVSGTETVLAAGQDLQWTSKNKTSIVASQGIRLYTDGKKADYRPVAVSGIALHAACGSIGLQAQRGGNLEAVAQQGVSVASSTASVTAQASVKVLLTAAKAYLKMEGGGIEIGAPGTVKFHAANHVLTGPRSADMNPQVSQSQVKACPTKDGDAVGRGAATL